ncbi:hypothetical protein KXR83_05825 [Williamsia muralis]|uniref:hypothetical protein n=1 Tax=Williamsia marianensis TaxID=85044 RepID=UPI003F1417E4
MAITFAGTDGTVTQSTGAQRWAAAGVPFLVDGPADLKVTATSGQQRTVAVAPGKALVCGVLVTSTSPQYLQLAANTGNSRRLDIVVLRITWASGSNASTAAFDVVQGAVGGPSPTLTRNPGVTYEAPLAEISVAPNTGQFTSAAVWPIAPFGGRAGPLHVLQGNSWSKVDAPAGTELITDHNSYRYRKDSTGTWVLTEATNQPWSTWVPTLRAATDGVITLGTGGLMAGRYKIVKSMVLAELEVRRGTAGSDFHRGNITVDLPVAAGSYFTDRWCPAHLYTHQESFMDWRSQIIIKSGATNGLVMVPTSGADCRMVPWRSADASGNSGTGRPAIATGWSEAATFTAVLRYSTD